MSLFLLPTIFAAVAVGSGLIVMTCELMHVRENGLLEWIQSLALLLAVATLIAACIVEAY